MSPNPKHKISFLDENDIYNPFSKNNLMFKTSIKYDECKIFIDALYKIIVYNDFLSKEKAIQSLDDVIYSIMMKKISTFVYNKSNKFLSLLPCRHTNSCSFNAILSLTLDDTQKIDIYMNLFAIKHKRLDVQYLELINVVVVHLEIYVIE